MEGNHTLLAKEQTPTNQTSPHMDQKPTREENQQERSQAKHQWQVGHESSPWDKGEGRWVHWEAGRPAHGPHRLNPSMWQLLIGWWSWFKRFHAQFPAVERVAPLYIYEGRGSISINTKHPSNQVTLWRCSSSSLVEVLGVEEFRFES